MVFCLSPIVINKNYSYYSCKNVTVKDKILAKEILNCFENYEFFGEFFENECTNKGRFVAKIKYSPEKGLQLEYSISDNEAPNSCERLFGVLSNGNRCTLIGDFNFDYGTHHVGKVCVKSGIHGFTKALAQEGAAKGVTVNAIAPGYVETDMVRAVPEKVLEKIVARIPVGRLGQAEDIARAVMFLVAEEAGFICGSTLSINGGQHMY